VQGGSTIEDAIAAFQGGDLNRARALAEREVEANPSARSLHLMGLIECRAGRVDQGIEWLKRALDEEPENAAYRVMFVRALVDSGSPRRALEAAVPPTGSTPPELALWNARAEAADALREWKISEEAWGRLCSAGVGDWRAWTNFANAAMELGHWNKASAALGRAIELNPTELPLRRKLAAALAGAGRFQESADELAHWVEASPEDVTNRIMFARLLADLGREQESRAQLDKAALLAGHPAFEDSTDVLIAIASKPDARDEFDTILLRELAQLLERSNRIDALVAFLDALEERGVRREQIGYPAAATALRQKQPEEAKRLLLEQAPETDPVRWHWLMSRIADALGEPATAFAEAEAMNRSVNDYGQWRSRAAAHIEHLRKVASTITPQWVDQLKTAAPDGHRNPAFLVGFPRSGTTLLDTFLIGHTETHVFEEVELVNAALKAIPDIPELRRSPADLARARDAYFAEAHEQLEPGFEGLIIDKFPLNMVAAPFIHCLFPGAPIIFAQRHPCDCVLSCFMQGFAINDSMACFLDIGEAAAFYDAAMQVWTRSREMLPIRTHTIVYEELVTDPGATLRPLIDFLGLDWRDDLLDHRASAKARGDISTPSYNQVTEPLSRTASGRWKRYEEELEPVLPVLLPWAERLGYRA
jgi:tetratricopeptide (TPR) repeat protein